MPEDVIRYIRKLKMERKSLILPEDLRAAGKLYNKGYSLIEVANALDLKEDELGRALQVTDRLWDETKGKKERRSFVKRMEEKKDNLELTETFLNGNISDFKGAMSEYDIHEFCQLLIEAREEFGVKIMNGIIESLSK